LENFEFVRKTIKIQGIPNIQWLVRHFNILRSSWWQHLLEASRPY